MVNCNKWAFFSLSFEGMSFKLEGKHHKWRNASSDLVGSKGAGHKRLLLFGWTNLLQVTKWGEQNVLLCHADVLLYHELTLLLLIAQHRYPHQIKT